MQKLNKHSPFKSPVRRFPSVDFSQESQFDGTLGNVFRRVFVPQDHAFGDAELGWQEPLVDDMLGMIRTHPSSSDGDARQRRIEAVQVEKKRTKVATQKQSLATRARADEAEVGRG